MIPLYAPLPYSVDYNGRTYRLLPYYDRVIEALDTVRRQDINPADALRHTLWLLIDSRKTPADIGLLRSVFSVLIEPAREDTHQRSIDFTQDAPLIYAAFRQAYGIDLREERQLHWWEFTALLSGLPADTRLMEIVRIRTMPVPKSTEHNAEQIEEIMRLKAKYAVSLSDTEAGKQRQAGLQGLARRLMSS